MEKSDIVDHYWKSLLMSGKRPNSVFVFTEELGIKESDFYTHFSSLKVIESRYWESTVSATISVLEEDADYVEYPVDQKLLAFFYTYITHIQSDRSRFVHFFPSLSFCMERDIGGMKKVFTDYMKVVVSEGVSEGIFADRKKFTESYDKILWMYFIGVIRFYIRDESDGFEDTDAFIEKSLKVGVESASHGVLDSGFDLLRFMVGKDDRLKELGNVLSKFIPQR